MREVEVSATGSSLRGPAGTSIELAIRRRRFVFASGGRGGDFRFRARFPGDLPRSGGSRQCFLLGARLFVKLVNGCEIQIAPAALDRAEEHPRSDRRGGRIEIQ